MRGFLERVAEIRDEEQMQSFSWERENPPNFRRVLPDHVCPACGESFYAHGNHGVQIYCSRECYRARKLSPQLDLFKAR